MGKIIDYAKCLMRNKLAIIGFGGALAGFSGWAYFHSLQRDLEGLSAILALSSSALASSGGFGRETYRSYRKAKSQLRDFGCVDERLREVLEPHYCTRAGLNLALEEFENGKQAV